MRRSLLLNANCYGDGALSTQLATVPALRPLSGLFDSVYFRKELNRDFQEFAALSEYAHSLGLSVHMLANSGNLLDLLEPGHT